MSTVPTPADGSTTDPAPAAGRGGDRAQYAVAAGLAVIGMVVLLDVLTIGQAASSNDVIGPRAVPTILGALLLVVAVFYALDVRRGGRGEAEEGEDVDLSQGTDWRTLAMLFGAFALNALLIDPLGWVISGSILFATSAYALGNRHHVRGLAAGIALSLITFYAFAIGLGVNLPAGVLQGIL